MTTKLFPVVFICLIGFNVLRLIIFPLPSHVTPSTHYPYYPCNEGTNNSIGIHNDENELMVSSLHIDEKNTDANLEDAITTSSDNTTKFLTYQIIKGYPFNATHVEDYRSCEEPERVELNGIFQTPGVLDFHTRVHTNLNILYIGSSIAMQLSQGFQEAIHSAKREVIRYAMRNRRFDWKGMHENTHISQTEDGGTVGALRLTGLFEEKGRDNVGDVAPNYGGGWISSDVREMKRMVHQWKELKSLVGYAASNSSCEIDVKDDELVQNSSSENTTSEEVISCDEKNFDVLVYQIPVEWMPLEKKVLTVEYLEDAVNLSFDEFGVHTVVLQTIPIMKSLPNTSIAIATNEIIWKYARQFNSRISTEENEMGLLSKMNSTSSNGLQSRKKVLVMDVFSYSVAMFLENTMANEMIPLWFGRNLKNDLSQVDDHQAYLNLTKKIDNMLMKNNGDKLDGNTIEKGYVCADKTCETKSRVSYDGMHWCMKETGGRMNTALACLMKCSLKGENEEDLYDCERHCNTKYMSLEPVLWEDTKKVTVAMTGFEGQR